MLDRFRTALVRRQALKRTVTPGLAPSGQMRGVQPLTAKEPSDLARPCTPVRLLHEPEPILGSELAPHWLGHDLRIRSQSVLADFAPGASSLRSSAPRGAAPACVPSPGLSLFSSVLTSTPYTNSTGRQCLGHVGREGCSPPVAPRFVSFARPYHRFAPLRSPGVGRFPEGLDYFYRGVRAASSRWRWRDLPGSWATLAYLPRSSTPADRRPQATTGPAMWSSAI